MLIAIDNNDQLVYQGHTPGYGYGLWPQPVLSHATLIGADADLVLIPASAHLHDAAMVFREDSFDAVTRIRRGRLYRVLPSRPTGWHVSPPGVQPFTDQRQLQLYGFDSNLVGSMHGYVNKALIALGTRDAHTLWRIVACERIVTGEDLLTLRARSSLGTLPDLNESKVPPDQLAKVKETLAKLAEAAYRAGPESIVDRAKDAAQWAVGTWLAAQRNAPDLRKKDLAKLAAELEGEATAVTQGVSKALARLHARGKPNVQEDKGSRDVTEDDAEFALATVGLLLREIGWAA